MDMGALELRLKKGDVGAVVATIGTTATGSIDPLPELLELRDRYGFRLHADAGTVVYLPGRQPLFRGASYL